MKIPLFVFAICLTTLSVLAESSPILFRSVVKLPDAEMFSVSTQDERMSAWVSIGDRFDEYTITEFVADEDVLVIHREGQEWRVRLAGRSVKSVEDDQLVISVSTLGFVRKPGRIEIRGENPTVLDVWEASGGGHSDMGNRLILTRTGEDEETETQAFNLPFDSPGLELEEELKGIPLQDRDVLYFPGSVD